MSIYKVERRVDTVIMEMDASLAEKLVAVLARVNDEAPDYFLADTLNDLYDKLTVEETREAWNGTTYVLPLVRPDSKRYRVVNDGQNLRVVRAL